MPVWHVSIAYKKNSNVKRVSRWLPWTLDKAFELAEDLLFGVGSGEWYRKLGDVAIHLRRRLSDEEIAGLPAEWLAIPAIDEAG